MMLLQPLQRAAIDLAVLLAALPSPAYAGTDTNANASSLQLFPATRLIGMAVENSDGKDLGKLQDLVLDLPSARLQYAIIASGGFLGLGTKSRIVPAQLLSAATSIRNTLELRVPAKQWRKAPIFRRSRLASPAGSKEERRIREFYGGPKPADHTRPDVGSSGKGRFVLASRIIGSAVQDRELENLGEVLDVLVAFTPRPVSAFAIVSSGRLFEDHERQYAVSLRALVWPGHGPLVLNAGRADLERAPVFDTRAPRSVSNGAPLIYRFERKEEYGKNQLIAEPG